MRVLEQRNCAKCGEEDENSASHIHQGTRNQTEPTVGVFRTVGVKMTALEYRQLVSRSRELYRRRINHIRKLPCAKCGNPESEGHHEDYRKPFDVIWLCHKHHREAHRKPRGYRWLGADSN
jgi:hypothetical protein